jgi:multidrug efflux pump subunit AcrA (membrane-fusion protein)
LGAPAQRDGQAQSGEEEPRTLQITAWGDLYEVFAEHRVLVVNTPTGFITHVTNLETLEPRREGPVTFVMTHQAGETAEHAAQQPERPGIYIPKLSFPKTGDWSLVLRVPGPGKESAVALGTVKVFASAEEAHKADLPESPEGIGFLKEQQWKILTKTEPVGKRRMVERLRLSAFVGHKPGSKAYVAPAFAGRLDAPPGQTLPGIGERVTAGQVVAVVQPPVAGQDLMAFHSNQVQIRALETEFAVKGAEIEANAIREKVAFDQAQAVRARMKRLHEEQAKSKRELEEAEFAVRAAQANMEAAAAMRKAYEAAKACMVSLPAMTDPRKGYPPLDLKAPITGVVAEVRAALGEHVAADQPVLAILNTSTVFIEARIPETELARLSSGLGAYYEVPGQKDGYVPILGAGGGRVVFSSPEIDPATRTSALVYEVNNPTGALRLGMALTLFLETARVEDALAIPEPALVDAEGRYVAYVMLAGETFEKRDLSLGIRDGGFVQVLSGLKEGERIVTKGAYSVRLASVSTAIPAHGHAH